MNQVNGFRSAESSDRTTLARQVRALVARLHPTVTLERRRDDRVDLPMLFRIRPLDDHHQPIEDAAITVVGKNISRRGMSFYHDRPLPYRRALISAEHPEFDGFFAEIDVSWCRFTKPGWYESGGRLIAAASTERTPTVNARQSVAFNVPGDETQLSERRV
jgi:hypothetical protein